MAEEKRGRKRERGGEGREREEGEGTIFLPASASLPSPLLSILRCLSILHRGKLRLSPEGTTLTGLLLNMSFTTNLTCLEDTVAYVDTLESICSPPCRKER